jgi:hypothetical protein
MPRSRVQLSSEATVFPVRLQKLSPYACKNGLDRQS